MFWHSSWILLGTFLLTSSVARSAIARYMLVCEALALTSYMLVCEILYIVLKRNSELKIATSTSSPCTHTLHVSLEILYSTPPQNRYILVKRNLVFKTASSWLNETLRIDTVS